MREAIRKVGAGIVIVLLCAGVAVGDIRQVGAGGGGLTSAQASSLEAAAAAPYVNRQYDAVVVVSTTITAALAAIADATTSKRYLLYVPDGTYAECPNTGAKSWVDIVGQSRAGVIVSCATDDGFKIGGKQMMLANMTINQSGTDYAVHADGLTNPADAPASSTTIVYNVTGTAAGKAGIGIGLSGSQRLLLIDSTFISTGAFAGVYAHNQVTQTTPFELTLINVTATGKYGLLVNPIGSGQADMVFVSGGTLSGSTTDVYTQNTGAGAGEIYVSLSESTSYASTDLVDAAKLLQLPNALVSQPVPYQNRYRDYVTDFSQGQATGITVNSAGQITKNAGLSLVPSTVTSYIYYSASNTGGAARFGMQDSVGSGVFTGGTAYAAIFGTSATYPLEFFQDNVRRARIDHAGAGFNPGVGSPLAAEVNVLFGQVVMPSAGTDGRFDVLGANGTSAIGVFQGNYLGAGVTVAGTNYTVISSGLARVAMAEDQAVTRGHFLVVSATAGYCNDSASISTIGLNIAQALYSEAVSATINPTGCGGSGCINTALDTPSAGAAGQITLGVDVAALGWAVNDPVVYWNSGGTTPTGLTDGKTYFLKTVSTTKVTIAATRGGAAVVPTTQGDDGTQYLQRLPLSIVNVH